MNQFTREILDLLKQRYEEVVGPHPYKTVSELQSYWLKNPTDNLIHPMDANAYQAYEEGAGKEISSGKIGALKSSSALTYNLFWDQLAHVAKSKPTNRIGNGVYKVEFEKRLHTLKSSPNPAHLDAFLYCKDTQEAVACEMKMTEWMFNKPGMLCAGYLDPDRYFDAESGKIFSDLAREMIPYEFAITERSEYPSKMERYDAFQMFKHTVACYNACKLANTPDSVQKIKKLTLVNCVWTFFDPTVLSAASRTEYDHALREEYQGFEQFKSVMRSAKQLFASIGVDFEIRFFTFSELLGLLKKSTKELLYLRRYLICKETNHLEPIAPMKEVKYMKERHLNDTLFDALKTGVLSPLLEAVKSDDTLDLECRGNYLNIYYRGGSLFKVTEKDGQFEFYFDSQYCTSRSENLASTPCLEFAVRNIPIYKQAMDWWFHEHPKYEREFQQVIVRENNSHGKISSATDYYIADIEYVDGNARFDMVGLKWMSKGYIRKDSSKISLALIEVKYGDGALKGTAGIKKHLDDFEAFLQDHENIISLCDDMSTLFRQKCELGLVDGLQEHQYKDLKISSIDPEVIFLFANHDPDSKIMDDIKKDIDMSRYHFPIRIANASNMGYGLYSDCFHSWNR